MDTASVPSFVRTLAIIILCYYLFKFAMRLLAPYLIQKVAKKAKNTLKNNLNSNNNNINHQPKTDKKFPKKRKKVVGDYIDYEKLNKNFPLSGNFLFCRILI